MVELPGGDKLPTICFAVLTQCHNATGWNEP